MVLFVLFSGSSSWHHLRADLCVFLKLLVWDGRSEEKSLVGVCLGFLSGNPRRRTPMPTCVLEGKDLGEKVVNPSRRNIFHEGPNRVPKKHILLPFYGC